MLICLYAPPYDRHCLCVCVCDSFTSLGPSGQVNHCTDRSRPASRAEFFERTTSRTRIFCICFFFFGRCSQFFSIFLKYCCSSFHNQLVELAQCDRAWLEYWNIWACWAFVMCVWVLDQFALHSNLNFFFFSLCFVIDELFRHRSILYEWIRSAEAARLQDQFTYCVYARRRRHSAVHSFICRADSRRECILLLHTYICIYIGVLCVLVRSACWALNYRRSSGLFIGLFMCFYGTMSI